MKHQENNHRHDQIDRYLNGQMTQEEQADFERELAEDQELREEVETAKTFLVGMEHLGTGELRSDLKATNEMLNDIRHNTEVDFEGHGTPSQRRKQALFRTAKMKGIGIAALLVFLIGLSYVLFFQESDPQNLFARHYEKPPNLLAVEMRSESSGEPELTKFMKAYEDGEYSKAIKRANAILESEPDKQEVRFYRGIMYLEQTNYQKALSDLEFTQNNIDKYREKALWYSGLIHLKLDHPTKAINQLQTLKESAPSTYRQKADKLLKEIN